MVDPSRLQIPFVSTWEDGIHFSKGLTFANKEVVKHALIIYAAKEIEIFLFGGRLKLNCALHALTPTTSGMLGHS